MTRAFLPLLHRSDDACVINMSSIYGLIAPPGQSAYAAAKFAVRGFSQALRHELKGSGIDVLVVHPGGVATSIARSARAPEGISLEEVERRRVEMDRYLRMPAEKAGELIVRALEQRRGRVVVGRDAKFIALVERAMPVSYWAVMERLMGR